MNIRARLELSELIAEWAIKHKLSPTEELELLQKQLNITKQALRVVSLDVDIPTGKSFED